MLQFPCPSCGFELTMRDDLAGRLMKCRKCGKSLAIPAAGKSGGESQQLTEINEKDHRETPFLPFAAGPAVAVLLIAVVGAGIGAWSIWNLLVGEGSTAVPVAVRQKTPTDFDVENWKPNADGKENAFKKKTTDNNDGSTGGKPSPKMGEMGNEAKKQETDPIEKKTLELVSKLSGGTPDDRLKASQDLHEFISKPTPEARRAVQAIAKLGPKAKCREDYKKALPEPVGGPGAAIPLLFDVTKQRLACLADIAPDDPETAKELATSLIFKVEGRAIRWPFSRISAQLLFDVLYEHPEYGDLVLVDLLRALYRWDTYLDPVGWKYAVLAVKACSEESRTEYSKELAKVRELYTRFDPESPNAKFFSEKRKVPLGKLKEACYVSPTQEPVTLFGQRKPAEDRVLFVRLQAGKTYAIELDSDNDVGFYIEGRPGDTTHFSTRRLFSEEEARMQTELIRELADQEFLKTGRIRPPRDPGGKREARVEIFAHYTGTYRIEISAHGKTSAWCEIQIREK